MIFIASDGYFITYVLCIALCWPSKVAKWFEVCYYKGIGNTKFVRKKLLRTDRIIEGLSFEIKDRWQLWKLHIPEITDLQVYLC